MKILIIDDHPMYRDGLASLVRQLFDDACVEQSGDARSALALLDGCDDVDLILLDLRMPGLDGRGLLSELRKRYPIVPVVVVSVEDDTSTILSCMEAGASGFIPKSARREILSAALTIVADGGVYLPPTVRRAEGVSVAIDRSRPAPVLTRREHEVLLGVCAGEPNKVIARRLAISEATVRAHLGAVFRALGVSNRTQAALAARRLGMLAERRDESR